MPQTKKQRMTNRRAPAKTARAAATRKASSKKPKPRKVPIDPMVREAEAIKLSSQGAEVPGLKTKSDRNRHQRKLEAIKQEMFRLFGRPRRLA